MLFTNWLRNKKKSLERWLALSQARRRRSTAHPLARTLLCLEVLENRITPSSFETLYSFTGGNDGQFPKGALLVDSNGNLDGTTTAPGGANGEGTVFQFNPSSKALTTLYSFPNASPGAFLTNVGVIQDSSGNFYGTTVDGGSSNDGTVFELSSDGTKFTILHSFTGGTGDGATPQAPLIMDGKGNLYGTTTAGGTSGAGTVFELSPDGKGGYNYTTLYSLNGSSDGSSPVQSLLMDSSGNLYGVAQTGGAHGYGTVFELSPNASGGYSFSVLHAFAGGTTDGGKPDSNLVMDSNGNLYGTTFSFGTGRGGTAFKITPSSDTYSTIYDFSLTGGGGYFPNGNILIDPRGNIYGVTEVGGSSRLGTVFELSPSGTLTTLHSFTGTGADGASPIGGLTEDSIGDFYGTTLKGGTNSDGTIFEIQGVITGLTTTKSSNATATFSTNAQNVTLTANVATGSGTVNSGTVTFTVLQGSTVIGTATTSSTVSNGQASVKYALPANLALGTYTIDAVYNPSGSGFTSSSDNSHTLTLQAANVTTTAAASPPSVPYSSTTPQPISLRATVTDASISTDTVNEGTVTFKVENSSGAMIGSPLQSPVGKGLASANFTLPAGQPAGNYSIVVTYTDPAGNFIDDGKSDTPGALQVTATPVTTTSSSSPSTAYSPNAQKVTFSANVVEPSDSSVKISEGAVTFTVEDRNGNTVGSPVQGNVVAGTTSGGTASAVFTVPAGELPGPYTVDVHYDDSAGGLADSGQDTNGTLTITTASVTTTASPASILYSASAQSVKLTAAVADTSFPNDVVNEGIVTFTIMNGTTEIGTAQGTVSGGVASANFTTTGLAAGSYSIDVAYVDEVSGKVLDKFSEPPAGGNTNSTLTIAGIPVNTAASADISAIYSPNQQTLALTASVTNPTAPANPINEGAVIFTVSSGGTTIGAAQGPVNGGQANASFNLPKGQAAGIYTVAVKYSDPNGNYSDNAKGDTSGTLNIAPANVVTTADPSGITFNPAAQTAGLSAKVADTSIPTDTVGEGTVTFTVVDSKGNTVGSADGRVHGGLASANFNWPAGRAAGAYTIDVSYSDSPANFTEPIGSGVSNTLTVAPAVVTTTAISPPPAAYSPNAQNVTLSADVTNKDNDISSTSLNAGTVLFTVENGSTVVGSVQGAVSGGVANANFTLPAGLAAGSYDIDVLYSDSNGNFTEPTSGGSATLTVAVANVATTANNATVVLPSSTSVTLSAIVSDTSIPSDIVNEGAVTFAVEDSKGNAVGNTVNGTVSGGIASANFALPSDLTAGTYTIGVSYAGSNNFSDNPIDDTGATLTVELAPTVTGSPTNDTVSVGGTAVFTAAANGSPTPTVQWQVSTDGGNTFTNLSDGTNVSGSTSTTLTLSNVQVSQSGYQYRAVFTNSYDTVHTSAATLTVPFATTVTLNPINQTVIAGKNVTFTAAANGGPAPKVQWQVSTDGGKTWSNISGATSTTLTLSNVQVSQSGYEYEAVFTQGVGSSATTTTTTAGTLTVQYAPTVTLNPKSQTATAGQQAAFTAAAASSPPSTVQWQVSTDGGKTFSDISGAINPTLTLAGLTTAMSGYEYQAVFTNSVGSTTTNAATLTVNPSPPVPVITVNPISQTVTAGATVSFTASASSGSAAMVQWQVSTDGGKTFSNIGGATGTTLTLPGVNPAMNGYEYQAVFSTGAGSAVSIPASLTVNPTAGSSSNSLALNVPPLLALLDQLIGGIETINANDTETVVYSLFGFSVVTAHYDGSGNFLDATLFGFSIPNWVWSL